MAGAATAVDTEGRGWGLGSALPCGGSQPWGVGLGTAPRPCDPSQPPFREMEQVRPREGQHQRHSERWALSGPHPGSWSQAPEALGPPPLGGHDLCPTGGSHRWESCGVVTTWPRLVCQEPSTLPRLLGAPCPGLSPLAAGVEVADQPRGTSTEAGLGRAGPGR